MKMDEKSNIRGRPAPPRFMVEGYALFSHEDKRCGRVIGVIEGAPQWAKDQYDHWKEERNGGW